MLVRDATWPVLRGTDSLFYQERIALRLSTPALILTPIGDSTILDPLPALQPMIPLRTSLVPGPQRSISVVEFAPPSPATVAIAATALDHLSDHNREIGNSVFFRSRGQGEFPDSSASNDYGIKLANFSDPQNPIQLMEPSNFEAVTSSYCLLSMKSC